MRQPGLQFQRPRGQAAEIRCQLAHRVQRLGAGDQGIVHLGHAGLPERRVHAIGAGTGPAQPRTLALCGRRQSPLPHRRFQQRGQRRPVGQPARQLQAGGQQVAPEVEQLAGAELPAQELHPDLVELMRLVQHCHAHAGQQLGHAGFLERQVSEEQVVVDDHQIGRHGLAPGVVDVAGAELGAVAAQAVLARGGDQRDHRRALVQRRHLGQVAGAGGGRPALDARQRLLRRALARPELVAGAFQPVQAQVAAAALEQRGAQRQAQRVAQVRQVAAKQLVLQRLGGGGDQHPLARQQRRHQVGEGLAHAGGSFHHQRAADLDAAGHGEGHGQLALPGAPAGVAARQRAVRRQRARHQRGQIHPTRFVRTVLARHRQA